LKLFNISIISKYRYNIINIFGIGRVILMIYSLQIGLKAS